MKINFTKEQLLKASIGITRKVHLYRNLGIANTNSTTSNKIKQLCLDNGIDIEQIIHDNLYEYKSCPVCGNEFKVSKQYETHSPKTTCSHSCSNTYFRSGINNGSHAKALSTDKIRKAKENSQYRTLCFHYHEKKCVVCGEKNIVAVHHYDENHYNNEPSNLIPLCPTHHVYMHSSFKHLIEEQVHQYVLNWKNNNNVL
ncbi:hypothetical protein FDH34_gp455 [Serratia phage BF]|uniref:HNH nuclease domain-containing protein n=1 Tax=Serratia phage BF TaxID=1962671 RepID=A0A1S6UB81_9CAUD|nr:hypothetical protein FDH34_gp455 [Serratia phage BF]AQW88990.1 hypothetical protein BF_0465 [Serratia phage BF]QXO12714.1 hypothetical protein pEaSNUABM49_00492 [Erwinia phage pEa_SNUABM_49]